MLAAGRESIHLLAIHAKERGVVLALENGWLPAYDAVLGMLLDELPGDHVGLCYDTGHEHVQGDGFNLLEKHGDRLFTVHIHDNSGKDTHELPGCGTIDWVGFRNAIRRLRYAGNILLEVNMKSAAIDDPAAFLCAAYSCAQELLVPME
jgi:sugar phosphate isomerase/epimerase